MSGEPDMDRIFADIRASLASIRKDLTEARTILGRLATPGRLGTRSDLSFWPRWPWSRSKP